MIAIALVMVPQLVAAGGATVPQTSPPPMMIQPMAVFTGHDYLSSSSFSVTTNSNQTLAVKVKTQAKMTVSEVGANIQLQEWSGSAWINLIPTHSYLSKNATYSEGEISRTTRSGYYYRAKIVHTVKHNGATETETEYTYSILAQ